jgi:hypothetical protein
MLFVWVSYIYVERVKFNEWRAQFIKLFLNANNNVLTVKLA